MKMRLKFKLIYLYTILIIGLIMIISFTSSKVFIKNFNEYVEKKQNQEILNVLNQVTELYRNDKEVKYEDLYNIGVRALDNGLILMVNTDFENEVICMSDILIEESAEMLLQMENTLKSAYPHFEGEYQEDIYEIVVDDKIYGYVTLGYYGPIYYTEFDVLFLKAVQNSIYKIGIIFVLISGVFVYYFADKFAEPISKVSKRAVDIGNGDYENDIELKSSTIEIHNLIESINILAQNLQTQKQVKKQLSQNYTHEIRTPITCVLTTLEGMQDGVFEVTKERVDSLYTEISHIATMVEGVDKLIETSDEDIVLNKTRFDLSNLVKNSIESFETLFENANIKLVYEEDKKNSYIIEADEEKIKSVVVNLLSNALKYTDEKGEVSVYVEKADENMLVKVKDTGIGIEEKEQSLIFEQLYRVEKSRVKAVEGFGIGLSICKNIVEAHEGEIKIYSELGEGSEFIVKLPNKES